jgi:hypothetical protein
MYTHRAPAGTVHEEDRHVHAGGEIDRRSERVERPRVVAVLREVRCLSISNNS